jgi:hypothetical protein
MVIHSKLHEELIRTLTAERSHNRVLPPRPRGVTVRRATDADVMALTRLAALDSAAIPAAPVLLAEVDGEPLAALSLVDGAVAADPFHRTADLVALLCVRAAQLEAQPRLGGRLVRLARRRVA